MTEPLKPRIDFTGTLEQNPQEAFKTAQTFSGTQADNFAPALQDEPVVEDGPAEAVVDAALRPKRSLWRRMVTAGLALFGVSVVGQGVQWTMNAWHAGLGGAGRMCRRRADCGGWRRVGCHRMASTLASATARERDEARDLLHSHGTGKGRAKSWPARPESISRIRRFSAGMPPSMRLRMTGKW
jgi:putative membrane protein